MAQKEPFCPAGRPGTEDLVPGFRVLLLSRDKGTAGRGNFYCPGTKGQRDTETFLSRDKGTTGRPVPVCPGTSRPLETLVQSRLFSRSNLSLISWNLYIVC